GRLDRRVAAQIDEERVRNDSDGAERVQVLRDHVLAAVGGVDDRGGSVVNPREYRRGIPGNDHPRRDVGDEIRAAVVLPLEYIVVERLGYVDPRQDRPAWLRRSRELDGRSAGDMMLHVGGNPRRGGGCQG